MGKDQLGELFKKVIKNHTQSSAVMNISRGIAKDVNEAKGTFTLVREHKEDYPEVSMNAYFEDKGYFLLIPKENSTVVVGFADGEVDSFLISASQIVKVKLKIGDFEVVLDKDTLSSKNTDSEFTQTKDYTKIKKGGKSIEVTSSDIVFNGGALGGLVKLGALVSDLNALKAAYNSHTHNVIIPPHTTPITVPTIPTTMSMTPSVTANLENQNVKQ